MKDTWKEQSRINAGRNTGHIYLSDCIEATLESLSICKQGFREAKEIRMKKYFKNEIEMGKIELRDLMKIAENRKGTELEHTVQNPNLETL